MNISHLFLALLANIAWGFNFIAGKIGADHFQPLFFTSIRFFILLTLLLPWLKPARGYMLPLLRVAFLLGVVHFGMIFMGIHAGGNIASVAITTQLYVPFSVLLAAIFLKEKISAARFLAISIAFAGVMIIGFDPIVFQHLDGVLWVSCAALAMAVATIFMRQCPHLGVLRLQAWIALVAAPSLLLLSLLFESNHAEILRLSQPADFWTPFYSATAASIVGHGIVYYLVGRYPVSRVTPVFLLAPILASLFGIALLDDTLGWQTFVGGTLTLAGILLVSLPPESVKLLLGHKLKRSMK